MQASRSLGQSNERMQRNRPLKRGYNAKLNLKLKFIRINQGFKRENSNFTCKTLVYAE